jgi:type IV pilus assembly protein PilY1
LTAGSAATPATSLHACGTTAAQDAAGSGALQLTTGAGNREGMVVETAPLSAANGLQITFTDYAFHGSTTGADGIAFFLTDASKPLPTHVGEPGAGLAYAGSSTTGLPNAYVGVGLDEYGNFSNVTGGPGRIP